MDWRDGRVLNSVPLASLHETDFPWIIPIAHCLPSSAYRQRPEPIHNPGHGEKISVHTPEHHRWLGAGILLATLALIDLAVAQPVETQAPAQAATEWSLDSQHWYVTEIRGEPAGWVHETLQSNGTHERTIHESKVSMSRGSDSMAVEMSHIFEETVDGEPVRLITRMMMSRQPIEDEYVFGPEGVKQITRQGGAERVANRPLPKGRWLTPRQEHRLFMERCAAGAKEIRYVTLNPEGGLELMTVTKTFLGKEEVEVLGNTVPVTVWKTITSAMPLMQTTEKISEDGVLVRSDSQIGGLRIVQRLATEAEAMDAPQGAGGRGPGAGGAGPEIMFSAFVQVDPPIENIGDLHKAKLRLRVREGDMPDLPSEGAQRVTMNEDKRSAVVTVDVNQPSEESLDNAAAEPYLKSSSLIESDDALIGKLAERAVRGAGESASARAAAMRKFVHQYISSKSLDTAFASAAETAKMKTGDCSEHAVLLCAMLRSRGIPARLASGLVYIDRIGRFEHVFGWHMWTQANLDGKWIDLDATISGPFHAGHILTTVSSFADDSPTSELAGMIALVGNLEVDVLEAAHGGSP